MKPEWMRWLGWALALGVGVLVVLIGWGLFDPQPAGELAWREVVETAVSVPPNGRQTLLLLNGPAPADNFTVRLTAVWESGELDSGIGLLVGETAVWVAPTGYLAVEAGCEIKIACSEYVLPWQWWPHVKMENEPNEIWLAVENGRLSVRVNREWLEVGEVAAAGGEIWVVGESFGGETAVYEIMTVELFAAN